MVFITIGTGIGAGIIVDGSLYWSSNHLAGEIGYMLPGRGYLGRQAKDFGVLESKASLSAISGTAFEVMKNHKILESPENLSLDTIFKEMLAGQDWARETIDDMLDYFSIAISNVRALLDPDLIVIRSGLDLYTELLIEPILRRIEGPVPRKPVVTASKLGYKATALGAIVEVLHETTNFYLVIN